MMDPKRFRKEVSLRLGRDVEASEFATQDFVDELQRLYWDEFAEMCKCTEDSGLVLLRELL
jgi:hypothetical protein